MAQVHILLAVRREQASQFYKNLSARKDFRLNLVSDARDALDFLADSEKQADVFVIDKDLEHAHDLIAELRHTYPRLLIILVDQEADFAMPGQADEVSTEPFTNDDLARRITRLMSDRRLETLRADAMPPVREFAKSLRKAAGEIGKAQAAVAACRDLGYEYVAYYRIMSTDPLEVTMRAQDGPAPATNAAPKQATASDIIGWVATTGQSRIAAPGDEVGHPLVAEGRLGAVACVPVGSTPRIGVLVAIRQEPGSISQQNVMMLELVSAQLAAVITKESIG